MVSNKLIMISSLLRCSVLIYSFMFEIELRSENNDIEIKESGGIQLNFGLYF